MLMCENVTVDCTGVRVFSGTVETLFKTKRMRHYMNHKVVEVASIGFDVCDSIIIIDISLDK